jgi:spore coat protein H
VNTVIQDWDQYGRMPHNYYLYADPNDAGRFAWIPWDHSLSLQDGGPSLSLSEVTTQWPLIRYLLDDEVYRQIYRDYVAETVQGAFAPDMAAERFRAAKELIAPYVTGAEGEQPGFTFLSSPEEFGEAVEQLVTHAQTRAQAVSEFLAAP